MRTVVRLDEVQKLVSGKICNANGTPGLSMQEITSIANQPASIEVAPVVSSNISALGYDEASETLQVVFTNGVAYRFIGVRSNIVHTIKTSTSVGRAINTLVKGTFPYFKVA